ncbi:MAG: DUF2975 domain-containing protein [Mariniphaga sp.]
MQRFKNESAKLFLIKIILWGTIGFSTLALVFHIRWFIDFLINQQNLIVPAGQEPYAWFIVQICNNIIFLGAGYLLLRLFNRYKTSGFFDMGSLKVFNGVILSCLVLAVLGAVQITVNDFNEVHIDQWTSILSISNLSFRTFTKLLLIKSPQTMYFLVAIILWVVKQFTVKALQLKNENETFI